MFIWPSSILTSEPLTVKNIVIISINRYNCFFFTILSTYKLSMSISVLVLFTRMTSERSRSAILSATRQNVLTYHTSSDADYARGFTTWAQSSHCRGRTCLDILVLSSGYAPTILRENGRGSLRDSG